MFIPAFLFIGIGVGLIFDLSYAGVIGLGVGLLVQGIVMPDKKKNKETQ